jgi:hypothetical protein
MLNKHRFLLAGLALFLIQQGAFAGTSSSSRSSSSGASASAARSGGSRDAATAPASRSTFTQRSAAGQSSSNAASALRSSAGRRSLLQGAPAPSTSLANVIQRRESSGPGWLGTAFLISLLSQHDLSKEDRSWINQRIDALKGEDGESPLLPLVSPTVRFSYFGLKPSYKVGDSIDVTASATNVDAKPVPVECALQGAVAVPENGRSHITYLSTRATVQVITCRAGGRLDRRLIRVAA